jgi:hypothetical protein
VALVESYRITARLGSRLPAPALPEGVEGRLLEALRRAHTAV